MKEKMQLRNSTAEFLIFTQQADESTIEVRVEHEAVWLTPNISYPLHVVLTGSTAFMVPLT